MGTSLAAEPLLALAVTVTSEQRVDSKYRSGIGITAGRGIGSDLAGAIGRPSRLFARCVGFPQIIFVSSQAPELPSIH